MSRAKSLAALGDNAANLENAIANVADDSTPELGANLDVNSYSIVSTSNGNISITPNGSGKVILDGLSWPTADGSSNQVLKTDGSGNLSFTADTDTGITDIIQDTTPELGGNLAIGSHNISGTGSITGGSLIADNITIDGNTISSTNSNGDINLTPNGTGKVILANHINVSSSADSLALPGVNFNNTMNYMVTDIASSWGHYLRHDGNSTSRWGLEISCGQDSPTSTNYAISIADGNGTDQGYITFSNGTVTYGAFSAYHEVSVPDSDNPTNIDENAYPYGTLVETTSIYYKQKNSSNTERGIRYNVQKAATKYSRKVLGAYCGTMNNGPDTKESDNLHQVGVLGDGHIICNNEGGNILIGDGICVSSSAGIGMKADKMCMCIGIAQEDITFSGSETKLVAVQFNLQQFTPWTD